MNHVFKLFGTIAIDNTKALSQISKTTKATASIGKAFSQAQATSTTSLSQIAAANGKTVNQIRSDVAKAAAEYRKQGMSASEAMRKAYEDIGYKAGDAHEEINKEVKKTGEHYSKLAATAKSVFGAVGNVALTCGKAVTAGLGASAAAVGVLMKSAVSGYAEYEQLVGGVDTLFKESSTKVQQYAANAYKTAGLSANEYMSTVTSFSASLMQSLKGDTDKAADVANMALTDMADNANKMGTSMSSIQDAYQGFAKQNYTMLDNLKLGYGGTKTEMQRLLKDAQKISGVKYNIKNLNDVYEAIHVIQTEMGITGTTALEASETISGSFASAGAAWQNLLVGLADGNQDMSQLMGNFVTAGKNVVRNVTKLLPDIVAGVQGLIEGLAPELPGIIQAIFPAILDGAVALFKALVTSLPTLLSSLGNALAEVWRDSVWPLIQDFFMIQFGITLPDWDVFIKGVKEKLEPTFKNVNSFLTDIGTLLAAVSSWCSENSEIVTGVLGGIALALLAINAPMVLLIGAGLLVIANWENIKTAAVEIWGEIQKTFETVCTAIEGFIQGVIDLWENWFPTEKEITVHSSSSGTVHGGGVGQGFATGLDFVPYNEMPARLHYGEAVLTREDASAWRRGTVQSTEALYAGMEIMMNRMVSAIENLDGNMEEKLVNAFSAMRFDVNNREFARMVKAVT